ncbi:hypothetical protein HPP92_013883 [Vanilla planifolia]|uniref:Uncharacterized protein n=1 Tax=Vanilla planifolia TaxID=51239 RepID=A0A835QUV4_VANPL|nr:hypothetical protein HPP92_013883 [Vanilla planifolia]
MLAATVGGEIHLFSVQSLISKVQEPVCSCFLDKDAIVRDLKWQRNSEKSFIALSNHGYLSHGSVDLLLKGLMDNVDAVSLELGSEKYLPRIDLQDDGDDNLILGLAIDKSSYGKISILQDMEVKELSSRCILLCVTCDGKLTLYHAVGELVAEQTGFAKDTSLHGDNGVNEDSVNGM